MNQRIKRVMVSLILTMAMVIGLLAPANVISYAAETQTTYQKVTEITDGEYVIVASGYAMTSEKNTGYTNSSSYSYSGFNGTAVTVESDAIASAVSENMVWTVSVSDGQYILKSNDGKTMMAHYTSSGDSKGGYIALTEDSSSAEKWTRKSDNSLQGNGTTKYLVWDTDGAGYGCDGLFTIRSSGKEVTFYKKTEGEVEVTPVAFAKDNAPSAGDYIIVASDSQGDYAMGTAEKDGYTNNNSYTYYGLEGQKVTVSGNALTGDIYDTAVWTVSKNSSGELILQNKKTGKYLTAAYSSSGTKGGGIALGDQASAATWSFGSNALTATSASNKKLTFDSAADHVSSDTITEGAADIFTVRSSADTITFYKVGEGSVKEDPNYGTSPEPEQPETTAFTKDNAPSAGDYIIVAADSQGNYAMGTAAKSGYSNDNNYTYYGLEGQKVTVSGDSLTGDIYDTAVWTVSKNSSGNLILQNKKTGKYLTAAYSSSDNKGGGIALGDQASAATWSFSSNELTATSASNKKLTFDSAADHQSKDTITSGAADIFTVRSSADAITFYKVGDGSVKEDPNYSGSSEPEQPESAAFTKDNAPSAGDYIIVAADSQGNYAMGTAAKSGYSNTNDYTYYGLEGQKVTVSDNQLTGDIYDTAVWTVSKNSSGNLILQNKKTGKYLTAAYSSSDNKGGGIALGDQASAATWSFSSNELTATSASNKKLTFDSAADHQSQDTISSGSADLFTVRSNADAITFYKVGDGSVKEDPNYGTSDPGTDPDPGSDSEYQTINKTFTNVVNLVDGKNYIIVSEGYALTAVAHDGYSNQSGYSYQGLKGEKVTVSNNKINTVREDMLYKASISGSDITFKNVKTGKYLTYSYTSQKGGYIRLESSSNDCKWQYSAGYLQAVNLSGKYLRYDQPSDHVDKDQISSGEANLYTVRSSGSEVSFFVEGDASQEETGDSGEDADPDSAYLAFSSDVHNNNSKSGSNSSATRLNSWINTVSGKLGGATFDVMGFCGDNGDAYLNGDSFWESVQSVMDVVAANEKVKTGIFTAGNHEWQNGSVGTSSNATAKKIKILGEAAKTSKYIVYCFGATSQNYTYNQEDIDSLDSYLQSAPTDRPIFLLTHYPLHSYGSRNTTNADKVISVLNKNAATHQIIYLWGHNHTESDTNYDKIITDKIGDTKIQFTYAAAGCMSDSEYSNGSASVKGKGMAVRIDKSGDVTMTYYTAGGNVVASATAVKPGPHTHSYGNASVTKKATCAEEGEKTSTCSCGDTKVEKIEKDPANHTGETEVRDAKEATLEEEGYTGDTYCKGCGAKLETGSVIPKLDAPHEHKYGEGVVTKAATCAEEGEMTSTCECGDTKIEKIEKDPANHTGETEVRDAKEATGEAEGYTGDTYCKGCGVKLQSGESIPKLDPATHDHNFGEGEVTKVATCAEDGERTYTCSCGETKVEKIAMDRTNHTGETEVRDAKNATFEEEGYTGDTYCAGCGVLLENGSVIPKLDESHEHSYGEGVVTKEATCAEEGQKIYTCSCGDEKPEVIEKNPENHTGETEVRDAKKATAEEDGYTGDTYCVGCGVLLESGSVIPKLDPATHDHTYETTVTKEATCVAEGEKTYTCECGDSKVEVLEKDPANHVGGTEVRDAKEATLEAEGYTGDTYCVGCGVKIETGSVIPRLEAPHEHSYGEGVITKEATCAEEGEITYTCECGDTKVEAIAKDYANHAGKIKTTGKVKATIDAKGYTGNKICSACGAVVEKGKKTAKVTSLSLYTGKTLTVPTKGKASSWKTSNKSVVTVSSKGRLKGVKSGKAKITCKIGKKTYTVSVRVKKCTLTVNASKISVKKGKKYQLTAKATPKATVIWTTSNKKIATVSETGLVRGKKKGTCTIYATANGVRTAITVTVK